MQYKIYADSHAKKDEIERVKKHLVINDLMRNALNIGSNMESEGLPVNIKYTCNLPGEIEKHIDQMNIEDAKNFYGFNEKFLMTITK